MTKVTSNQPEPVRQRIYGSKPVAPLEGASNQPEVLPHTKVYGVKKCVTVRVRMKDNGTVATIAETDFDPDRHEQVG